MAPSPCRLVAMQSETVRRAWTQLEAKGREGWARLKKRHWLLGLIAGASGYTLLQIAVSRYTDQADWLLVSFLKFLAKVAALPVGLALAAFLAFLAIYALALFGLSFREAGAREAREAEMTLLREAASGADKLRAGLAAQAETIEFLRAAVVALERYGLVYRAIEADTPEDLRAIRQRFDEIQPVLNTAAQCAHEALDDRLRAFSAAEPGTAERFIAPFLVSPIGGLTAARQRFNEDLANTDDARTGFLLFHAAYYRAVALLANIAVLTPRFQASEEMQAWKAAEKAWRRIRDERLNIRECADLNRRMAQHTKNASDRYGSPFWDM